MFKPGDVVYFKQASKTTNPKVPAVRFKGHGLGVVLGGLNPFQQEPNKDDVITLMASIGYISFDQIEEFLGKEVGTQVVGMFEKKYYEKSVIRGRAMLEAHGIKIPPALTEVQDAQTVPAEVIPISGIITP